MASKLIEQFRQHGLAQPIRTKPRIMAWLFLLLGAPFLVGGAVLALITGNLFEQAVGGFGLVFFGLCFLLYAAILLRSGRRGMLEFSRDGIYHSLYGLEIAWRDVGPAWVYGVTAAGASHRDVMFILRRASHYKKKLGWVGKRLFSIMERQAKSQRGGALETGIQAIGLLGGRADVSGALEEMRQRVANEDDAVALGIPRIIRFELSDNEIVEIVNSVILERSDQN